MAPPALDDDPGLSKRVEDLSIKQFVAQPGVEALNEAVLPGTAPLNVGRLSPNGSDPIPHRLGDELWSVVGSDMFGYAAQNELIGQNVDHVGGLEFPVDPDGQTFVRELVDEVEHPILPPIVRAILDEVIGPHMVGPLGAQTDAGSVRKPDATLLGLFGGDLQPLAPPDPLDPLVVDDPAGGRTQHLCDLPIAKAAVPAGQLNDVGGQPLLIVWPRRNAPLGGPMLSKHPADPALRQFQLASNMVDAGAPARGA